MHRLSVVVHQHLLQCVDNAHQGIQLHRRLLHLQRQVVIPPIIVHRKEIVVQTGAAQIINAPQHIVAAPEPCINARHMRKGPAGLPAQFPQINGAFKCFPQMRIPRACHFTAGENRVQVRKMTVAVKIAQTLILPLANRPVPVDPIGGNACDDVFPQIGFVGI